METATKQVTDSIWSLHLNTGISALMELLNELRDFISGHPDSNNNPAQSALIARGIVRLISLLNPFAPHITEELWEIIGREGLLSLFKWDEYDPALLVTEEKSLVIQINGKVRGKLVVPTDMPEEEIKEQAKQVPNVQKYLTSASNNGNIRKIIYVKDRLVNIVV